MCEYCNLERYREHYWKDNVIMKDLEGNDYTHMEIQYNQINNMFSVVAIGDDETSIDISFCPMCGRKLGGE